MGYLRLNKVQLEQLTGLRDALKGAGYSLGDFDVEGFIEDFVRDSGLRRELFCLTSPTVSDKKPLSKAISYCLTNRSADRDALIAKLYEYFIGPQVGVDSDKALELISAVLFVGGVDTKVNAVLPPSGTNGSSTKKNTWIIPAAIAIVVLLVSVFSRSCGGKGSGGERPTFTKQDVCRSYNGSIVKDGKTKTCELKVSVDLLVTVVNVKDPDDFKTYKSKLKGDELRLSDGPDLLIERTKSGRIKLSCDEGRSHGKWAFSSK